MLRKPRLHLSLLLTAAFCGEVPLNDDASRVCPVYHRSCAYIRFRQRLARCCQLDCHGRIDACALSRDRSSLGCCLQLHRICGFRNSRSQDYRWRLDRDQSDRERLAALGAAERIDWCNCLGRNHLVLRLAVQLFSCVGRRICGGRAGGATSCRRWDCGIAKGGRLDQDFSVYRGFSSVGNVAWVFDNGCAAVDNPWLLA